MKIIFICITALAILSSGPVAHAEEILVIVNKRNSTAYLTTTQVKQLYLGKRRTLGNKRAKVLDRSGRGKLRRAFLLNVLSASPRVFDRYWISKSYRQGTSPPSKMSSSVRVIEAVTANQAAVGYVPASQLSAAARAWVKVVARISVKGVFRAGD